jgi:hypothetical protein
VSNLGIDLHTPDRFLTSLWVTDAGAMARMLVNMAAGLKHPPLTAKELVGVLGKNAPRFFKMALDSSDLEAAIEGARDGVPFPSYRPM